MKVVVQLFAAVRQALGSTTAEVELPQDATVQNLRNELSLRFPALDPMMPHLMVALSGEFVDDSRRIPEDAEVALIPPVSGG
jgi:molybdopterin synthase catalytic subunit